MSEYEKRQITTISIFKRKKKALEKNSESLVQPRNTLLFSFIIKWVLFKAKLKNELIAGV